ncbi:MAG: conjugal transfer protein TraX [Defluviitaleaceae bacterium]|nr:conjugal transfer protein TraX [Defluviitaleaceae bacterium]
MALQHTALVFGDVIPTGLHFPFQLAGGLTFPIMAFFLVEGYRHTSNVNRYMARLFLWGVISQVPYMMAFGRLLHSPTPNVMFTLFLSLLGIVMYDRLRNLGLFVFLFAVMCGVSIYFDWGVIGPVVVLIFHIIDTENLRRILPPIAAAVYNLFFILLGIMISLNPEPGFTDMSSYSEMAYTGLGVSLAAIMFPVGSLLVVPLILRYNGERGRSMKYLFYGFYPLHLFILALAAYAAGVGDLRLFVR